MPKRSKPAAQRKPPVRHSTKSAGVKPVSRTLRRGVLAEWLPVNANGNRQWCIVVERRDKTSTVRFWHGVDRVANADLRVVTLQEAAKFQQDWNNLPVIVTELLVWLTCLRNSFAWPESPQIVPHDVVIAGLERHDGQAPWQYRIKARDVDHAAALVTAFHQGLTHTTDTKVLSSQLTEFRGQQTGHWNDLYSPTGGRKMLQRDIQTIYQWHMQIARRPLPGRYSVPVDEADVKLDKLGESGGENTETAQEPV